MDRVQVAFDRGGLVVAVCGSMILTLASSEVTREYLEHAARVGRELGRAHPRAVGSLTLTTTEVPLPSAEIRALAQRVSKESDAWVKAATTVVHGTGFKASVLRSLLVTMTVFAGGPPRRVFAEPIAALDWLGGQLVLDPRDRIAIRRWAAEAIARSTAE